MITQPQTRCSSSINYNSIHQQLAQLDVSLAANFLDQHNNSLAGNGGGSGLPSPAHSR